MNRPPLPEYLPSNMTPDEVIAAIEPCVAPGLLQTIEDAFNRRALVAAEDRDSADMEETSREKENLERDVERLKDVMSAMIENYAILKAPCNVGDRESWFAAKRAMERCVEKAKALIDE